MDNKIQMHTTSTSRAEGRGTVSASISIHATSTTKHITPTITPAPTVRVLHNVDFYEFTLTNGSGSLSAGGLASSHNSNAVTATASNDAVAFALGVEL